MLCILEIDKCRDSIDIEINPYTPYRLVHFWDIRNEGVRKWFHALYNMKGGVKNLYDKWNVVVNRQDIHALHQQKVCVNRILFDDWDDNSNSVSYIFSSYIPKAPHH